MKRILYVGNKLSSFGFTPTSVEYLGKVLEENGYPVLYAGEKKNKILRLMNIVKMLVIHRDQYDIILIDVYSTLAFYFALAASFIGRLLRKPYVPILHGGDLPARFVKSPFMIRSLLNHARVTVSPSAYLHQYFKEAGFPNILCIPNAVSLANYPFQERKSVGPNLLWVRSFHTIYNPAMAIEVLRKMLIQYPKAQLVMIGPDKDGVALAQCKKLIHENNLSDHVMIHGRLSKEEWITISKRCDIFINTTNFDNAPVSVVEAMALGLLVVSTNVGGIPFLLTDGRDSLLVNARDADAMVEKIEYLLSHPDFSVTLSNNARASALKFDDAEVIQKWNQVFKRE